jgi:hypothetical protein
MPRHSVWELVFFMVVLKIPIVYLCMVLWVAIKAEPTPEEGAGVATRVGGDDPGPGRGPRPRGLRRRPHGRPSRTYPRAPRPAGAAQRSLGREGRQ